jgi:hypothetical protein
MVVDGLVDEGEPFYREVVLAGWESTFEYFRVPPSTCGECRGTEGNSGDKNEIFAFFRQLMRKWLEGRDSKPEYEAQNTKNGAKMGTEEQRERSFPKTVKKRQSFFVSG